MGCSVRYAQQVTTFPAGVQAASTWDTSLIYARGYALGMFSNYGVVEFETDDSFPPGSESKALVVHVQLGPVAGYGIRDVGMTEV
jgi:beta-glucosidase